MMLFWSVGDNILMLFLPKKDMHCPPQERMLLECWIYAMNNY